MLVTGVERLPNNRIALKVDEFDDDTEIDGQPTILINCATPLAITGPRRYGTAHVPGVDPFWVAYDTSDGTPAFGEQWGVESGEWSLKKNSDTNPFTIIGLPQVAEGRVLANYVLETEGCLTVHEILIQGSASGGTFDLEVTIVDSDDNDVTETLADIPYNCTNAQMLAKYNSHSLIASGDVTVRGGPLPNTALYVVFTRSGELVGIHQDPPVPDSGDLTGVNAVVKCNQVTSYDWD